MGYTSDQATMALKHSTDKSLDGLITWIDQNPDLEKFIGQEGQAAPAEGGENPDKMVVEEPKGQSISSLVNQDMAKELEAMGISKNVREKALLMTSNASVEAAFEWIEKHREDPDFEEEMLIVQEDNKPKLSAEEAAERARELQVRLREKRKKQEEQDALERERNRISGGKALTEAKRIMEEQQRQRDVELKMKEKKEDDVARNAILQQLENDRRERFGDKYVSVAAATKEKPPIEQIHFGINQMKKVYPPWTYGEQLKVCWNTIKTVLGNIIKNPDEPKFQSINLSNPNFKARVLDMVGGEFLLKQCGFEEENGHLVLKKKNLDLYKEAIQVFEKEMSVI